MNKYSEFKNYDRKKGANIYEPTIYFIHKF